MPKSPDSLSISSHRNLLEGAVWTLVRTVVFGVSVILSGNAFAVIPPEAVGKGGFYGSEKRFCNFSKTVLGKTEGILMAAHCVGMNTEKDLVFVDRSRISAYPALSAAYGNLPVLPIGKVTNRELIGETVYVQGFLENDAGEIRSERIYGMVVLSDEGEGFLAIRPSKDDIESTRAFRKKSLSFWKGISSSPIMRAKDDTIVGIMSRTTKDGSVMHFSGPDNVEFLSRIMNP